MIERYSYPPFPKLWSDEFRFSKMLEVELAVLKYYHQARLISDEEIRELKKINFSIDEINELEKLRNHDVLAFTESLANSIDSPAKKWIHYGLTSTDVVDTAMALILQAATSEIIKALKDLLAELKILALEHREIPSIGRTHGMHAEETRFGLKWCLYYDELSRRLLDLTSVLPFHGKISGAVGNFNQTPPELEEWVCGELGLRYAKISTQVISRDYLSTYVFILANIASALEKIALEIRHLSRSEVGEVSEEFRQEQKGSSAMPHKKNPISAENICGCARVMRSYVGVALENNALWHERDISHSSAERIILADATTLIHYMLKRMTRLLSGLALNKEKIHENLLMSRGLIYSGHLLNYLVKRGLSREESYKKIQPLCFLSLDRKVPLLELLKNEDFYSLEIEKIFEPNIQLMVDEIYRRIKLLD